MLVWGLDGNCMYLYLYSQPSRSRRLDICGSYARFTMTESPLTMKWGRDEVEATPERLLALFTIVSLPDHLSRDPVVGQLDHSHLSFSVRAHLKGRAGTRGYAMRASGKLSSLVEQI